MKCFVLCFKYQHRCLICLDVSHTRDGKKLEQMMTISKKRDISSKSAALCLKSKSVRFNGRRKRIKEQRILIF